jgi:hypothetical protein
MVSDEAGSIGVKAAGEKGEEIMELEEDRRLRPKRPFKADLVLLVEPLRASAGFANESCVDSANSSGGGRELDGGPLCGRPRACLMVLRGCAAFSKTAGSPRLPSVREFEDAFGRCVSDEYVMGSV